MGDTTCTVVVTPPAASGDQYAALAAVFGLMLCALVFVWGAKQVLKLFTTRPEA